MKSVKTLTAEVLGTMTREELRTLATHVNVPRGKDTKNTIANLSKAAEDGKIQIKSVVSIYATPAAGMTGTHGKCLFSAKLRNYKPSKVLQAVPPLEAVAG